MTGNWSHKGTGGEICKLSLDFVYIFIIITIIVGYVLTIFWYLSVQTPISHWRFSLTCSHPWKTFVFDTIVMIGNIVIVTTVIYIFAIVIVAIMIVVFTVIQNFGRQ